MTVIEPPAPSDTDLPGPVPAAAGERCPPLPPRCPRRHAPRFQRLGRWLLTRWGWRIENAPPDLAKQVVVVAPHTPNWDFPVGVLVMASFDLAPRWLGKHTLFRPPLGAWMRRIGGIPVRRHGGGASGREGAVAMVVEEFARADAVFLALSPEGTRRRTRGWKSGYYAIAEATGAPVVPCWIDWSRRVVGFGPPVRAVGGVEACTARLMAHYHAGMARRPERF